MNSNAASSDAQPFPQVHQPAKTKLSSSTTAHRDGMSELRFLFQVSDITTIDSILAKFRSVEGVFEARRMMPGEGVGRTKKQ